MKKTAILLLITIAVICLVIPAAAEDEVCFVERVEYLAPQSEIDIFDRILDIDAFADYLRAELSNFKPTIDIRRFNIPFLLASELYGLIDEIIPDCFYAKAVNIYGIRDGIITEIEITYLCKQNEVASYQAKWDKTIAEMLDGLDDPSLTDVQKALLIHDRIILHCEYDSENLQNNTIPPESYTPFGVILKEIAVCQGYAETYRYLLGLVGIDSYLCSSKELNHTWNIVVIDREFYYVDVTWDDPEFDKNGNVYHNNFLCSYDDFKNSHKARDYDRTPNDEKYDDYFWEDSMTAFQLVNGEIYYVDNNDGYIRLYDGTPVLKIEAIWFAFKGSSSYWPGFHTKLASRGNKLYYSYPNEIFSYNTETGKTESVYTPIHDFRDEKVPNTIFSIFGFKIKDDKFICEVYSSPNFTLQTKKNYTVIGEMPPLEKFLVKFDANGGQSAPGTQMKTEGTALILTDDVPKMDGYRFKGWATTQTGKVEYRPGDKYLKDNNVTLYAVWEKMIINVTGITLDLSSAAIYRGETLSLKATVYPENATDKSVRWSSSDENIATVDENGKVTALTSGIVTITATTKDGEKSAECRISISKKVASKIKLTVGSANITAGNTVTVDISIDDNPGVAKLAFELRYDSSVMTLKECTDLSGANITADLDKSASDSCVKFSLSAKKDFEKNGKIVSLTFEVNKDAVVGDHELSIKVSSAENEEQTRVEWISENGRISIVEYKPGDLSGDGEITTFDAVALAQAIAGWSVNINKDAADCNGDGSMDTRDAVLLAQFLAGWKVDLVFLKK